MTEDDGNPVDQREVKQEGPFLIAALMQPYEMKLADVVAVGRSGWGRRAGGGFAITIASAPDSPDFAGYDLRFTPGTRARAHLVLVHFPGGFYR